MSAPWPYDPDTRALVARRLWQLLPSFYRVQDQAPRGDDELRRFLTVLAAPLAVARQSIEELHANLFIDSCDGEAVALLADLVATTPLFPDAEANRRDVRSTVAWRRRKGTPRMLEDMARELSGELVVLQEGWQRIQLAQDLNLIRRERVAPDLRPAIVAETASGPLDAMHHALDLRAISARTGKYHPGDLTYWRHPTRTWPLREGSALYRGDHGEPLVGTPPPTPGADPDWRYSIHPLGQRWALRVRDSGEAPAPRTDRVPAMHFAAAPDSFFARAGGFTIRVAGLPAAVAAPERERRPGSDAPAELELAGAQVGLRVLEWTGARLTHPITAALCVVALGAGDLPDLASVDLRTTVTIASGAVGPETVVNSGPVAAGGVVMMRLTPPAGVGGAFFPGATLAIHGGRAAARLASTRPELATRGYLRGAMIVELPPMWVFGERWLYLAGDGSVVAAQQSGGGAPDVAIIDPGGAARLNLDALLAVGPGAAWPPRRPTTVSEQLDRVPPSRARGPAVLHGGIVVAPEGVGTGAVAGTTACALEFAARSIDAGIVGYRPMVRLSWSGSDPAAATWTALDDDGLALPAAAVEARFAEIALWRDGGPTGLRLALRFVSDLEGARLCPAELAWAAHDGRSTLLHLPELTATAAAAEAAWPSVPSYDAFSTIVEAAEDGSTRFAGIGLARMAEGGVAPLREAVPHLRRRLRWRKLCPWDNETALLQLEGTPPGLLDVDVEHGLFALALAEPPQPWPEGPAGPLGAAQPSNVTVDFEAGYSDHVGARPASREVEIDARLPAPTRLVSRSGALSRANDSSLSTLPCYRSLTEALAAIAADPEAAEHEVVQLEDSASYRDESPSWPANVPRLTLQAAEGQRPLLRLLSVAPPGATSYTALTLTGLAWEGADLALPAAAELTLQWCSVLRSSERLELSIADGAAVHLDHCLLAGVVASGAGTLRVDDCAVDTGRDAGLTAFDLPEGELAIERSTVIGTVGARRLEASEVLFIDLVTIADRFTGCIRYSAVPEGSSLPRRHRVVEGLRPRFVSSNRHDPAHLRLAADSPLALRRGAADGGEIGVFHDLQADRRRAALQRRLDESTPVGLAFGLVRVD